MRTQFLPLFLLPLCLAAAPTPESIETIVRDVSEGQEVLARTEAEKREVLGALYQINEKVRRISHRKEQTQLDLMGAQSRVQNLSREIQKLETVTTRQRQRVQQSLLTIYKFSGRGVVGSVFSQLSGSELDRFLRYLKILSERDARVVHEYQDNLKKLRLTRERLNGEARRLALLAKKIKRQEADLLREHNHKQTLLARIDREHLVQREKLQHLRSNTVQASQRLNIVDQALLAQLQPSFIEKKGQIPSPLPQGQMVQGLGVRSITRHEIKVTHKGVFLAAQDGSSAFAVYNGKVGVIETIPGFGQVVVLDHGHHYYTVYGNLASVGVRLGDTVSAGRVVGNVGSKGLWGRAGLYFEIRHFADPEDPESWIKSDQLKVVSNELSSSRREN